MLAARSLAEEMLEQPLEAARAWTCPACHAPVATPFCPRCGEEPVPPADLTLRGLAAKLLHAFTSIDARAARTLRDLLRHPGRPTLDWTRGLRKPYVAPFQIFLLANVLFFSLQWLTGENVFSSTLESHLHQQDWSEFAQARVARRLEAMQVPLAQYAPVFDRAVVLHAKSLIVLMAMVFAAVLPLAFVRARRPFMVHVVFALHVYTFLLLLFCVALLAAKASSLLGLGGLEAAAVDNVISVANLLACALYLYAAIGPVYGSRGATRLVQALLLAVAVAAIVLGYRFALFLITLYVSA